MIDWGALGHVGTRAATQWVYLLFSLCCEGAAREQEPSEGRVGAELRAS